MLQNYETDPNLDRDLRIAAQQKMTAAEIYRQRVSFILGSVSEKSHVTKEDVVRILAKQDGRELVAE
ncbi:MAG: hypothetical protein WD046_13795 [Paracoccaceae bacterium]